MQTVQRAIHPWAVFGWLGLVSLLGLPAPMAEAAAPPERALPESTVFFVKINNFKLFRDALSKSQYGQLWNDPSFKAFRDEFSQNLEDSSSAVKGKVGLGLKEILDLPQGSLAIAAVARDDANAQVARVVIAEMGENEKKTLGFLDRGTKQAEEAGAKVSTESFQGLTLHIALWPAKEQAKPDKDKEKDNEKEKDKDKDGPPPPLVWTNSGSTFYLGTDVDAVKDVAANREGRDRSLAATESYTKTQAKTDSSGAQVIWFIDAPRLIKLLLQRANEGAGNAQGQQIEVLARELGVFGLKSIGGCFTLGTGNFDSVNKIFFHAPRPVQGLLKVFSFPPITLRPEPWVPASVASYQTLSIDLNNAFDALNSVIDKFQPGMVGLLEQQLVGPNGGQPLNFKNDVFGPLGGRVTLITDYKKPSSTDSQRMMVAIALKNTKAFQATFSRLLELTGSAPQKREFQGTAIYDFPVDLPAVPGGGAGGQAMAARSVSIAIAKDTLFLANDATLLEQVLRPGNAALVDKAEFQSVAKEFPERCSALSYVRPDQSTRIYDLIKSGQIEKQVQQAMIQAGGGRDLPELGKIIPTDKLPEFSVLAKYLGFGGGSSIMDDDGFTLTGFTLRRANP
jgi:hypothetical protein